MTGCESSSVARFSLVSPALYRMVNKRRFIDGMVIFIGMCCGHAVGHIVYRLAANSLVCSALADRLFVKPTS